jgi:cytochrome P450
MGVYLPTRYEDARAIAYDTEHFSSHRVVVREGMPPEGGAAPITTDPPKHAGAKSLLLPAFTLDAIERYAAKTREICRELVEKIAGKSACDAAVDYAQEMREALASFSATRKTSRPCSFFPSRVRAVT